MKISRRHFTAQEDFLLDTIRDTASYGMNSYNYGLLPEGHQPEQVFDIYNSATNDVQLHIRHCQAITQAGYRIAIDDLRISVNALGAGAYRQAQEAEGVTQWYILISVNPFDREPAGGFDPEETPPRHLHTLPKYHVELVPAQMVNHSRTGGNYIVAGRILSDNGLVTADAAYIPPCTSLHSHPVLLSYYNAFAQSMAALQQYALRIVQKNSYKNQNSSLAASIRQLCETLLQQFAGSYFYYRNMVHQQPPVHLISIFAQLAHALYVSIELLPPQEKEEALNYCFEWSEVPPHTLLNELSAVVEINYDHHGNGTYMKTIERMLRSLCLIFEKLSGLEYIGQHKENIVVKEEAVTRVVKDRTGWSILD
jgi:hypothetical protein